MSKIKDKKISMFSLALIGVLLCACISGYAAPANGAGAQSGAGFPDTRAHWAGNYINALCARGALAGMPDGNFYPEEQVTAPQFIAMILRLEYGEIKPVYADWASGYIAHALELGVVGSEDIITGDAEFIGDTDAAIEQYDSNKAAPMSRFDAVKIVHNSLLFIFDEPDEDGTDGLAQALISDYPSCHACRAPYDGEIAQCYAKGIINGKPGNVFDGEANLTRAEACVMIMKMIDVSLRNPLRLPVAAAAAGEGGPNAAASGDAGLNAAVSGEAGADEKPAYTLITAEEAREMIESGGDIFLLDVRDKNAHALKRISGSVCIPYDDLVSGGASLLPENKNAVIIVYCFMGATSADACGYLNEQGYTALFNIAGGIGAWPYDTDSN